MVIELCHYLYAIRGKLKVKCIEENNFVFDKCIDYKRYRRLGHLSLIDCWANIKYKHSNCSVYLSGLYMEHTYTSCKNISILCTFIDILQILSRCKVKPIDNWPVAWGMRAWTYDLCWFMFYFYLNILKHIHFEWHILSKHS